MGSVSGFLKGYKTYIAAAGMVGLAVFQASTGDYSQAIQSILAAFPDDPAMTSIGNWDLFEESRPETFVNMFSIRCRKPAKGEIATPNPTTRSKQ